MKVLKAHFPDNAEVLLLQFMQSAHNVRYFRRAQALLEVVRSTPVSHVAELFSFSDSNIRIWIRRFEKHGIDGLLDKPRSGRPKKVTPEIEDLISSLAESPPLSYGCRYSQWTASELARVVKEKTTVSLSQDPVRKILKKKASLTTDPRLKCRPMKKKSKKRKGRWKN